MHRPPPLDSGNSQALEKRYIMKVCQASFQFTAGSSASQFGDTSGFSDLMAWKRYLRNLADYCFIDFIHAISHANTTSHGMEKILEKPADYCFIDFIHAMSHANTTTKKQPAGSLRSQWCQVAMHTSVHSSLKGSSCCSLIYYSSQQAAVLYICVCMYVCMYVCIDSH